MASDKDCLFCKIAQKKLPSKLVFENENIVAFADIDPKAPVHILVIPRKHIESINDISKEDEKVIGEIHSAIKQIAQEQGISANGYRVVVNTGAMAGQAVAHIHYHILGGRDLKWPPG